MTDRELMQQALDALEYAADEIGCPNDDDSIGIARKALRARLTQPEPYAAQAAMVDQQTQGRMYVDPVTGDVGIGTIKPDAAINGMPAYEGSLSKSQRLAQPEQEPVAQVHVAEDYHPHVIWMEGINAACFDQEYLYITPPQREFIGLTENEKEMLWDEAVDGREHFCSQYGNFADAIEAKIKEKNAL